MINVSYVRHGIKINAVWFCEDVADVVSQSKSDIVFLHSVGQTEIKCSIAAPQQTLLTDLSGSEEDIFKQFNKTCRKMINRAEAINIAFEVYDSKALAAKPELVDNFKKDYTEFTAMKGIQNTYNEDALKVYITAGAAVMTKAVKDGEDYAQHIYINDGRCVRGLYSVSKFRIKNLDTSLTACANRFLHWSEMKYFKTIGVQTYDWSGLTSAADPNGVDSFKLSFGGNEHTYFNILAGKSVLGKILIFLMRLFHYRFFSV